jgi:hypothetical protein
MLPDLEPFINCMPSRSAQVPPMCAEVRWLRRPAAAILAHRLWGCRGTRWSVVNFMQLNLAVQLTLTAGKSTSRA